MKRFFAAALCCLMIYTNMTPFTVSAAERPELLSETAVLIDGESGQILYEKDAHKKMYPASTTKILTGLLAVELGNMSDVITYSHEAVYGIGRGTSHASISEGEQLTLEQSMYALSIESANDAAAGIGEYVAAKAGKGLSELMNERAKQAGALNSNFVNAHGLHHKDHYTTAYDLAMIAKECIKYEDFNKIFTAKTFSIPPTNKQKETRTFNSANWFTNNVYNYGPEKFDREDLLMTKTGWTGEAQHTMVTAIRHEDMTLIAVVMKTGVDDYKWNDTEKLFNWALETFKTVEVSGEYIALCAREKTPVDNSGKLYVKREDMKCDGISVTLSENDDINSIRAEFCDPVVDSDMRNATFTAKLYSGEGASGTLLASVNAYGPISEGTVFVSTLPQAEVNMASDMVMCVIFGLLTFVAVMICDILIGKRI